ncbi:hypothetical protein NEFER03_0990 [Nematocida sp. LUAm3]|nr:hypothetical protein NEFER03_0990 [Nematocida sp. LUAm3]KAI5175406.1 hypothetical protein NEFER02_1335 [Nematocida sp. LUAm2]KAI5177637.1 hypothetical protein NEFER01_0861 [Nematocida sp. LUAm1]
MESTHKKAYIRPTCIPMYLRPNSNNEHIQIDRMFSTRNSSSFYEQIDKLTNCIKISFLWFSRDILLFPFSFLLLLLLTGFLRYTSYGVMRVLSYSDLNEFPDKAIYYAILNFDWIICFCCFICLAVLNKCHIIIYKVIKFIICALHAILLLLIIYFFYIDISDKFNLISIFLYTMQDIGIYFFASLFFINMWFFSLQNIAFSFFYIFLGLAIHHSIESSFIFNSLTEDSMDFLINTISASNIRGGALQTKKIFKHSGDYDKACSIRTNFAVLQTKIVYQHILVLILLILWRFWVKDLLRRFKKNNISKRILFYYNALMFIGCAQMILTIIIGIFFIALIKGHLNLIENLNILCKG